MGCSWTCVKTYERRVLVSTCWLGKKRKGRGERCSFTACIRGGWSCVEAMHANFAALGSPKLWMGRRGALCLPGIENHLYG